MQGVESQGSGSRGWEWRWFGRLYALEGSFAGLEGGFGRWGGGRAEDAGEEEVGEAEEEEEGFDVVVHGRLRDCKKALRTPFRGRSKGLYRGFAHTFKRIVPRGKGEREYQQSDADSASPHLNIYQPPDYRYAVYHRFNPSFSHIPYSSSIRSLVLR